MVSNAQFRTFNCGAAFNLLQIAYAKCHIDWAKKNLETWTEARSEVDKIQI